MNFLFTLQDLVSYSLLAADGKIGRVRTLFFDDVTGVVRYLMVDSTYWLQGQPVLISPVAVGEVSEISKTISVELTREQIASAPRLSPHAPISRTYEQAYFEHYNWPPYWEHDPVAAITTETPPIATLKDASGLCNSHNCIGLKITADQSVVGKLEYMIVDIRYWLVRYLGINISEYIEDKTVLINLAWIEWIDLQQRMVKVDMSRETIQQAPPFYADKPISRAYESSLFSYHRRQPYWL